MSTSSAMFRITSRECATLMYLIFATWTVTDLPWGSNLDNVFQGTRAGSWSRGTWRRLIHARSYLECSTALKSCLRTLLRLDWTNAWAVCLTPRGPHWCLWYNTCERSVSSSVICASGRPIDTNAYWPRRDQFPSEMGKSYRGSINKWETQQQRMWRFEQQFRKSRRPNPTSIPKNKGVKNVFK